jgi:amino acid transporter
MGRDERLPTRFFGYLHPVRSTPTYTLLLLGALAGAGALVIDLDHAAQLVNFGACIAFMMVNISVFAHYYLAAPGAQRYIYAAQPDRSSVRLLNLSVHLVKYLEARHAGWICLVDCWSVVLRFARQDVPRRTTCG